MIKRFFKNYCGEIIIFTFLGLLVGAFVLLCVRGIQHQNWYNSLPADEKAAYDAQLAAEREKNIYRYDVVSVSQYIETKTNNWGGVIDTDVCYHFQFLQGDDLKSVDGFQHLEYGLTKVIVGDKNMYIVDKNGFDEYRYLQLTEETLKTMKVGE